MRGFHISNQRKTSVITFGNAIISSNKKIETNFLKTVTKEQGKICKHYHNKNMSFIDKFHSIKIL